LKTKRRARKLLTVSAKKKSKETYYALRVVGDCYSIRSAFYQAGFLSCPGFDSRSYSVAFVTHCGFGFARDGQVG